MTALPVAIALGANLGDRAGAIRAAVDLLRARNVVTIARVSPLYHTAPMYRTDQPQFLNAAVIGHTGLRPRALLAALKRIEADLGRIDGPRNGPRAVDLDILFLGTGLYTAPGLDIPHPRLRERAFVLVPLAAIAADWRDPVTGNTCAGLLAGLDRSDVVPVA